MGNLCGKPSKEDPFSQPGHTVGSAPAPKSRSSVPRISSQGQGQTSGGSNPGDRDEARRAAARAAEERAAKTSQPKGKLERELANQKKQTRTGTLENIAQDERRRRDADQTTQAISYN